MGRPRLPGDRTARAEQSLVRIALNRRGPGEWNAVVDSIPDFALRVRVARIIWWDYFASKRDGNTHLDKYIDIRDEPAPVDRDTMIAALVTVGYHPETARTRVSCKEYWQPKREMRYDIAYR